MARTGFIDKSVFEFKLPFKFGFAYCKILDFRHIREFDGLLAKVFNLITDEPIANIKMLQEKEWLFGARRMAGIPTVAGKNAWKYRGIIVSEDDQIIPEFKYSHKLSPLVEDESVIKKWSIVKNIDESTEDDYTYEEVRHLETTVIASQYGIGVRTAMEYCRINALNIADYFDLDDPAHWSIYRTMINIPIYSSIPKKLKGKAGRIESK